MVDENAKIWYFPIALQHHAPMLLLSVVFVLLPWLCQYSLRLRLLARLPGVFFVVPVAFILFLEEETRGCSVQTKCAPWPRAAPAPGVLGAAVAAAAAGACLLGVARWAAIAREATRHD